MFDIRDNGDRIVLLGRFDASQTEKAKGILDQISESAVVDFSQLDYISSAGLGVLLGAQKRLAVSGKRLRLTNMNHHIREIFRIAGFDQVFEIE
jgi:anti-sigma B factor antagonist